jgi:hypothetical protein
MILHAVAGQQYRGEYSESKGMALDIGDPDEPGPNGEKPDDLWRDADSQQLVCPFCGRDELSDDRLGFHLVRDHWEAIDDAANGIGDP